MFTENVYIGEPKHYQAKIFAYRVQSNALGSIRSGGCCVSWPERLVNMAASQAVRASANKSESLGAVTGIQARRVVVS